MTSARASASAARPISQEFSGATTRSGSRPVSPCSSVSGTANSVARPSPFSSSIDARWLLISRTPPGGTRFSTTASAVLRCCAVCSRSHGTASAYRAADVQKIQRSAADSSWPARRRFSATTESMSGASSSARPRGTRSWATTFRVPALPTPPSPVVRDSSGRMRSPVNQSTSAGLQTSTGPRVVGRSQPERLTAAPTRVLTRVDLPAPVDPPTTASRGASRRRSRGSR